jgi:hypothetical protein
LDNFFVNVRLTSLLSGLLPILYLPIPSPKISEMRAVEYHAFFVRSKKKAQKETTAHARYNKRFTMFKPMP